MRGEITWPGTSAISRTGDTPSRRAPRSRTSPTASTTTPLLIVALIGAFGCDSTAYDFGHPLDTDPVELDGAVCEELEPVDAGCGAVDADGGCLGARAVPTVRLGESLGCTPEDQSLGVLALGAGVAERTVDIYAWAAPPQGAESIFDESVSLGLFRDRCGDYPVGGEPECEYRPWVVRPGAKLDEALDVLLHVQTQQARTGVVVGYQLRQEATWDVTLLAPAPADCFAMDPYLRDHPPWDGEPRSLDLSRMPPPLGGEPWMCGAAAAGWRQAGYQLHNGTDHELLVTRIGLLDEDGDETVPFHFAFYSCPTTLEVDPASTTALASSCHDDGLHSSKQIEIGIARWVPDIAATEYVLILQVPPTAGTEVQLVLDVEAALESAEKR